MAMERMVKEVAEIDTVHALNRALDSIQASYPDGIPVGDGIGDPLVLRVWEDMESGERRIEIS